MTSNIIDDLSSEQLAVVVELQRVELNRLLGEQRRLTARMDALLGLQEREQVPRQQMQTALDHLVMQRDGTGRPQEEFPSVGSSAPLLSDRLDRAERRFRKLRAAVGQLLVVLERQRAN